MQSVTSSSPRKMHGLPRKLILRELKKIKWHRKFSTPAVLQKDEFILKSTLSDVIIPKISFTERLWKDKSKFANLVALESVETKKSYTYDKLQNYAANFATFLVKYGLKPGDVVGLMLPNCPEFPVVALGTLQAGCVLATINPIYKEFEVSHHAKIAEPKLVVTSPECYDSVVKGLKTARNDSKIIIVEQPNTKTPNGTIKYSEIAENGKADYTLLDKIERKEDDLAIIPFSSGTTGLPKGVEITYKNILAAVDIMERKENCFPELACSSFQDIVPCILPFYHIYGMIVTLFGHLSKGCKLTTLSSFSANLYLNHLKTQDVTLLYVVPPVAILLGKHPDVTSEHFRKVKRVICGAAPLAASDAEAILEKSNNNLEFSQGYGTTETTSLATVCFIGAKIVDYDCSGAPMAGVKIKFVDPISGDNLPIGQSGEICVGGPIIMKGYHKNEEATKECITEDGFFKTGDLGYYNDTPGHGLKITDRIKELIKVKGLQVAPAELESILRSHPKVAEAAVIGVPHEFYGETPKAFVILKKDAKIPSEELQQFVANKVASFKKIEEVVFVNEIPKTASGKILRRDLKKMYA
ncbi:uncharacterized protein LOC128674407 [Plodia interpunctella]|uniref:uncharacterized protein LOC128674407 n=1 Tax=Plodia interpunctella TaxID=58824 RepID=UPI002368420E|nr:uncharacterized protein LOC128674407 [Plodia interpunctella]